MAIFYSLLTDPEERWFEIGGNTMQQSNSFNLDKSYNFLAGIGTYVGFDDKRICQSVWSWRIYFCWHLLLNTNPHLEKQQI